MSTEELVPWINSAGQDGYRNSMQEFEGDGSKTSFEFNFSGGYINVADVKAYVYDSATGIKTDVAPVVLTGPNTIQVVPALPAGQFLIVYRDTQKTVPLVDFVNGAVMNEENLDTVTKQAVFNAAEMVDRFDEINATSTDAIERSVVAVNTANAADAKADSAVGTANAADSKANAAVSTANSANSTAGSANTKADAAVATANGIDGKAQTALDNSVAAVNTANGIDGKATTALSNSSAAVATANSASGNATTALNTANGIDGKATTALSTAQSADTKATTALSTADLLVKADPKSPCLLKTGASTLSVKAGTVVVVGINVITFAVNTAVTMPSLVAGSDYSVWAKPDGTAQAVVDTFNAPATAPVAGSRKIGGFHYGLVAPGTTVAGGGFSTAPPSMVWTQAGVDKIAGINEYSIWDLLWRSKGEQHGMALDPQTLVWVGIYFCSTNHVVNGISRYNTDVASGTVLPRIPLAYGGNGTAAYTRFSLYEAQEVVASHNTRLITYEEFMSAMFGVAENASLGGAAVTIPSTGRAAGFTSRIGIEQATGHIYSIGGPFTSSGGTAWAADPGRGSFYGTSGLALFGGNRGGAELSGSRGAYFGDSPWSSNWSIGVRAVGDHLNLASAAR